MAEEEIGARFAGHIAMLEYYQSYIIINIIIVTDVIKAMAELT